MQQSFDTPALTLPNPAQFEPLERLNRDLNRAASTLTANEARFLVDFYYTVQNYRIRFANQIRAMAESGEPHELIRWMYGQAEGLEKNIQKSLDVYSLSSLTGKWARSISGVGPVIAAGLLAHIDVARSASPAHLWSFAGLNPEQRWQKGEKRPWNTPLKVLTTFKLGESFVKVQNRSHDFYGHLYAERKKLEQEANEYGFYDKQAATILASKKFGKDTEAFKWYSQGKLPPAHIHARARRYAVKLFLAHYWNVSYEVTFGKPPEIRPYAIEHLGHVDYIAIPHWPLDEEDRGIAQKSEFEPSSADVTRDAAHYNLPPAFVPGKPLFLTLAQQLARFREAIAVLEARQLPAPSRDEEVLHLVSGYVPEAQVPTLAERLRRFRAQQQGNNEAREEE